MSTVHPLLVAVMLGLPLELRGQENIGMNPGDTITVATGQGFVLAIVTAREGHVFRARIINGPEVTKRYPAEVRRRGKSTAYDRANGVYEVGDRIRVLYQGKWIDSEVIDGMGMEYRVALPGNLAVWAKPDQIQFVSEAPPPAVAKAGEPPRPGLVSCAGKVEGRYAGDGTMPMQMTFRSGKVTFSLMGETKTRECWYGDGKLFVTMMGEEGALELDLNDDGSLQGPFGELKKKAK
ncbi:MAG: hypothetical protein FJ206_11645 [Gemmatimonadetes bacterium]|nr:hypothetical protein [Gemmatimonadota bacterium]